MLFWLKDRGWVGGLHFPDVSSVILMSELPAEAPEPGPTLGAAVVLLGPPGL